MTEPFSLGDASRFIDVIDNRISKAIRSNAKVESTWGTVYAVSTGSMTCDVFLYGETDPQYVSTGFRIPDTLYLTAGDVVKVSIDYGTGDRWVEEQNPAGTYKRLYTDWGSARILFGSGSTLPDVNLYRATTNVLATDDVFHAVSGLRVTSPSADNGQNFEAVRIVLPNNGYTGLAIYAAPTHANPVFKWAGYGAFELGAGDTSATDTRFSRSAPGVMRIESLTAADDALMIGDDSVLFDVDLPDAIGIKGYQTPANGKIVFGSGKDTSLYRGGVNRLDTPGSFVAQGFMEVGGYVKAWSDLTVVGDLYIGRLRGSVEFYDPSNPFIDWKVNPANDYDYRMIYNLGGSGLMDFVGTTRFSGNAYGTGSFTWGKTWGFVRSGATTTQASGNLPFATAAYDSHSGQYNATNKTWTIPTGGAGIWIVSATVSNSVTGAVSVTRGSLVCGTTSLAIHAFPLGGTYVGSSVTFIGYLADGDNISFNWAVVNGTSYTASLSQIAAVRVGPTSFSA